MSLDRFNLDGRVALVTGGASGPGLAIARGLGAPDELIGTAVFFASAASDFVTGQVLFVDGGFAASM